MLLLLLLSFRSRRSVGFGSYSCFCCAELCNMCLGGRSSTSQSKNLGHGFGTWKRRRGGRGGQRSAPPRRRCTPHFVTPHLTCPNSWKRCSSTRPSRFSGTPAALQAPEKMKDNEPLRGLNFAESTASVKEVGTGAGIGCHRLSCEAHRPCAMYIAQGPRTIAGVKKHRRWILNMPVMTRTTRPSRLRVEQAGGCAKKRVPKHKSWTLSTTNASNLHGQEALVPSKANTSQTSSAAQARRTSSARALCRCSTLLNRGAGKVVLSPIPEFGIGSSPTRDDGGFLVLSHRPQVGLPPRPDWPRREPVPIRGYQEDWRNTSEVFDPQRRHAVGVDHHQVAAPLWHTMYRATPTFVFFFRTCEFSQLLSDARYLSQRWTHVVSVLRAATPLASWLAKWMLATCQLFDVSCDYMGLCRWRARRRTVYSGQDKKHTTRFLFLVISKQITLFLVPKNNLNLQHKIRPLQIFLYTARFGFYILSRTGTERGARGPHHTDQSENITSFGPFRINYRHPPTYITVFVPTSINY